MIEEWRAIPGFFGYEVSNIGRVRSYKMERSKRKLLNYPRILQSFPNMSGYQSNRLTRNDGKNVTATVHSLVALAFIGPRPPDLQINHRSGDKTDNSVENLEYVTRIENMHHAFDLGIHKRKVTADDVRSIRSRYKPGNGKELADEFGVSNANIHAIVKRKTWNHV